MPSTVIQDIEYNPETKCLVIQFVSGLLYAYADVPQQVYTAFEAYREKGVYFNLHIKNKYKFTKVGSV